MTARGISARKWSEEDSELIGAEVWVERTDRNEVQVRVAESVEVFLTLDQVEELADLLRHARAEGWRAR